MMNKDHLNNKELSKLLGKYLDVSFNDLLADVLDINKEEEPENINLDERDIDSMIDLALATGDKEWFVELTEKKAAIV
jgi:hypothetical protein